MAMVKKEKRLQRMRQNPKTVTYDILVSVLQEHGFVITAGKGSHVDARIEVGGRIWRDTLVKPHGNKKYVSPAAVKKSLKHIDEIEAWKAELAESEESDNGDND
jgi:hypothetical protein